MLQRARVLSCLTLVALSVTVTVFAQAPAPKLSLERVVAALEPEIKAAMEAGKIPSCTVALVVGDKIVWQQAYGYSNLWAKTPARLDSVYLIGSTFKAMSTVALLQLQEQGKFKLDDPVNQYLGDLKIKNEDPAKPVTFRHLLTHVSGLPADFGPFPLWADKAPPALEEYLRASLRVQRPPLEKEEYSNLAFSLIGYLVERLSGAPFKDYVQTHVFEPLEMESTAFNPRPDMDERLTVPYVPDEKTSELKATPRLRASVWPAGLVYGTIANQANWLIANLNGGVFKGRRVIGEQTHAQMLTKQFAQFPGPVENLWGGKEAGFGLTWWVEERGGDKIFAHSGSVPGYTAFLQGNRTRRLGFAILTNGNRAHPHLIKLADRALELLKQNGLAE
ncbi:MAG: beta-lactamase family protein [Acidobacteria bacterium]|nr:beta-lactamase family protein [Acidobacteriota bacterium]MBI3425734.1 beta-lactamase family protein [Acidobacteriota bacterium]